MRVAITADWMDGLGGAERVLMHLHAMFPDAPVYTAVHSPDRHPPEMQGWDVRTSFIQRIPLVRRSHLAFLALMPAAFERFDLSDYDLVLSTNSAFAKGVVTPPGTPNVCYCYTPCRYLWDLYDEYTRGLPGQPLVAAAAEYLRRRDLEGARRVDRFVAISHEVAGRIRRNYGREAEVIYPPVDVHRFSPAGHGDDGFYLVVSRLVGYKRVELAVQAATRLGRPLLVVGDGPERERLQATAGPGVRFLGRRPDAEVAELMSRCRALVFPGLEDFGITPVEAQAAGRPVVAYGAGGALETVIDGETGVLFPEQTVEALVAAIERLDALEIDPFACRRNAERFDASVFRRRMRELVEAATRRDTPAAAPADGGTLGRSAVY